MILLKKLILEIISERMTFNQLLGDTDNGRARRSTHVSSKSVRVMSMDEDEAWTFSYKSQGSHSTTGKRWKGYVRFLKENVEKTENAGDIDCMVDCTCPDYKYRFAYNNAKAGAGVTGNQSWNGNNGNPPRPRELGGVGDYGNGLCKHLVSIGRYLQTEISPSKEIPVKKEPSITNVPSAAPTTPISKKSVPASIPSKDLPPEKEPTTDQPDPEPDMMAAPQPTAPSKSSNPIVKNNPIEIPPEKNIPDELPDNSKKINGDEDDYTDSREDNITEGKISNLFKKIQNFVKTHKEFDVPLYED